MWLSERLVGVPFGTSDLFSPKLNMAHEHTVYAIGEASTTMSTIFILNQEFVRTEHSYLRNRLWPFTR